MAETDSTDQPGIDLVVRQHCRDLSPKMRGAVLTATPANGWTFVASGKTTTAALIRRGLATPYLPGGPVSVVGVLTDLGRQVHAALRDRDGTG